MDKVSIIIPCYNSEKTIGATLRSVLLQTMINFECIIIDDNSSDNSLKIIHSKIKNDKRFSVKVLKKNVGVVSARNMGLKLAKGRFICFLDSDDLWSENFLELSLKQRKISDFPLTHTKYLKFFEKDDNLYGKEIEPPRRITKKNILQKNHIPILTVMIDKKFIGEFSFSECRPEDYFLWHDLINKRGFNSTLIDQVCAFYRLSKNQRSSNKLKSFKRLTLFFYEKLQLNIFQTIISMFSWSTLNLLERSKPFNKIGLNQYKIFEK